MKQKILTVFVVMSIGLGFYGLWDTYQAETHDPRAPEITEIVPIPPVYFMEGFEITFSDEKLSKTPPERVSISIRFSQEELANMSSEEMTRVVAFYATLHNTPRMSQEEFLWLAKRLFPNKTIEEEVTP